MQPLEVTVGLQRRAGGAIVRPASRAKEGGRRAVLVQFIGGIFAPTIFHGTSFELMIAGFGTVLFVGAAFVDFYTMPRTYRDDQYLAGALGMYLTYINLFVFLLRLIIAIQGGGRRD